MEGDVTSSPGVGVVVNPSPVINPGPPIHQPQIPGLQTPTTPPALAPLPNKEKNSSFFLDHWEKLLALLIGGCSGFFGAVLATKSDISDLSNRLVSIETKSSALIEPKLSALDQNLRELELLKQRLAILEKKDETATMITRQLEERIKNIQLDTLRELQEILSAAKPKN